MKMHALRCGMLILLFALTMGVDLKSELHLRRCASAKEENPNLLSVLVVVSSYPREFNLRSELRRRQFQKAQMLHSRTVWRPSKSGRNNGTQVEDDRRPVCVQPIFVLSPWVEMDGAARDKKIIRQDEWYKIVEESETNHDVLIAPTIIDHRTGARELMHVLEWSRQTVPWADYVVSTYTGMHIHWSRMIELFPPPVSPGHLSNALWYLGSSVRSQDALFFKDARIGTWRECADVGVAAFSRDLVQHIANISFATQIDYGLHHPFRMVSHKERCKPSALNNSNCLPL